MISQWFPIEEVSVESVRERSTSQVPGVTSLHVWFARRPLETSRMAVLGSLLPSTADKKRVLKILGLPENANMRLAQEKMLIAKARGVKLSENPFWWDRAFKYIPTKEDLAWIQDEISKLGCFKDFIVVDPMAGGGSIPFEAMRLGLPVVAGDLNPVAFLCLKGTLEYPARFGEKLLPEVERFCKEVHEAAKAELEEFFPKLPHEKVYAYLWARTIKCSSCGLVIPLSPNWWVTRADKDEENVFINVLIPKNGDICSFEIISSPKKHQLDPNKGTVKGGRVECPRCHTVIDGEEVKFEAQSARMGHQLCCVYVKSRGIGKNKANRDFKAPTKQENEAIERAQHRLKEKLPKWEAQGLVPTEAIPQGLKTREPLNFGMTRWCDLFNSRQLLTHLTYLEKFLETKDRLFASKEIGSEEYGFAEAIITYGAMVFDRCLDNNCLLSIWNINRTAVAHAMGLQAFPFKWSYAEWDHSQMLWQWSLSKVLDALKEITSLLPDNLPKPTVYCGSATKIPQKDRTVPCIVVDPPYAENVMYAEVSDFFYVWLKRLLGTTFPEAFKQTFTEKEEEAVANPVRFKGMGRNAKKLAQEDYKTKMESAFKEMNRILQDDGVMTVMFTHRTAEAWSSLATALMNAGFTFVSSWPVHTEPTDKYAKQGKGVLKVTVLLTCLKRNANHPGIWEHITDELREVAKQKIQDFSLLGINGPDLKVSVYAPVLGKFADYYPVKTATGKEIDPQQALDVVTDVLNERFLQEAGIQNADKETAAYINLLATFPNAETEYEEARLATVFGGLVTLDTLDVKGMYGIIEKDGKNIKILSARDRQAKGIIDPHDTKTLKTTIDYVHAAILQYERGGLVQVKKIMQEKNLEIAGSPFPTVLQAYARYADNSSDDDFQKDAAIAKALLAALGKSIEFAPKKGELLDHYVSES